MNGHVTIISMFGIQAYQETAFAYCFIIHIIQLRKMTFNNDDKSTTLC